MSISAVDIAYFSYLLCLKYCGLVVTFTLTQSSFLFFMFTLLNSSSCDRSIHTSLFSRRLLTWALYSLMFWCYLTMFKFWSFLRDGWSMKQGQCEGWWSKDLRWSRCVCGVLLLFVVFTLSLSSFVVRTLYPLYSMYCVSIVPLKTVCIYVRYYISQDKYFFLIIISVRINSAYAICLAGPKPG